MSLGNPDNYDNIYQVGGSLPVHASTYVRRLADQNLYEGLLAGNFCYVLNSRQMGKSSLRVQTMKRLQEAGKICTAIDLTSIGSQDITPEQWYAGIIYSLASGLELLDKFNLGEWWQDRQLLAPLQRLGQFLSEIVLREIQGKIVIFIDEIDSVLSLSFNVDDFFGLIRSCYQKDSNYERLAFALFGVASPADLIRNKNTNNNFNIPFNIGQAIDLQGFQLSEAMPLAEGFRNIFEKPEEILRDILDWTGGQPFLTQKVCKLVSKYGQAYSENIVSNVVQEKIIENWEGQDEPEHLKTIRDRLLYSSKNKYKLLELYYRILQEGAINDQNLPEYTELRLTGLVVKQNTKLKVYNRIYAEVFNLEWLTDEFKSSGSIIASGSRDNVSDPFIYISRGLTYYNAKDYEGAIFNYSQAIELNPNYASAYNYRGNVHSKLKDYKEAISDYNRAISIEPHYIIALMNRGLAYFDLEKYQEAISDFEQVINIDPNHTPAYYHRGVTYYELGDYERAITDYNKTINIEPNDIKAYDKRANTYRELGKYEEAIADYDQVISIDPSYIVAYIKRREKVHRYLKDSDMNKINFYHSRGLDSYKNRDYYGAISDFEQIIGIHPNDALAYNNRGRCFFKLGKYQEALNDYNQAISIDPYSSFFYRNRGEVYCSLNYYEAAIADYNRAINIEPNDNIAHMGWAIAQKKLNQSLTVIPDIKENIDLKSNINQNLVYKTFEFETVTVNKKGEIIKRENKQAQYFTQVLSEDVTLDMVLIPAGEFMMGAKEEEKQASGDKYPQHKVRIAQPFFIGKYPVTQAQYEIIMGNNPSGFQGENRPVEQVSWEQAIEFCKKLSQLTGKKYSLPSEAQWEYAARAGTTTPFYFGETITSNLANYDGTYTYDKEHKGEYRKQTTNVGIFPPNAFGLYDIHGNVWEWCEDTWHDNYEETPNDGKPWVSDDENLSDKVVLRGGSWYEYSIYCRVALRANGNRTNIDCSSGFRVCCLIEENVDNLVETTIDASVIVNDHNVVSKYNYNSAFNQDENSLITTNLENSKIKIFNNNRGIDTRLLKIFEFETVTVNSKGEIIKRENKQAQYFTEVLSENVSLDMVLIPAGEFMMGAGEEETGASDDEYPQHKVTMTQPFFMGKYPITQSQYEVIMGKNPSRFQGKNRPVERVSWEQALEFCEKLSKLTGKKYSLPSEAQWEYVARAGTRTPFYFGETITSDLANYDGNYTYAEESKGEYRKETTNVGIFPPNAFGLYDIHGNVWEWCQDIWHDNYQEAPDDGSAWLAVNREGKRNENDTRKTLYRGGSWGNNPNNCRVSYRTYNVRSDIGSNFGFRVCCLIEENVDILFESQEQLVNQQLRTDPKYICLEQLLANQEWKEADEETARVMLKIAKREEETFLNKEAIENFPCDDLEIIDQLWLKYSSGLFGFSVQGNIWLECGGKLDYEIQCKLGDRLGWRKQGTWLKYEELDFDIATIYPGHLPWYVWGFLIFGKTSDLISKIISSNLSNTQNKNLIPIISNQLIEQKKKLVTIRQNSLIQEGFLGDFSVNGKLIRVFQGDITNLVADVIVTFDNNYLTMRSPPSAKIRAIGGKEIYEEAQSLVRRFSIGDVIVTKAGKLPCKRIFHTTVRSYTTPAIPTLDTIRKLVHSCLEIAENSQFQSLAMPLLATGCYGFSRKMAWKISLQETIKHFSNSSYQYLQEIVIVIDKRLVVN